MQIINSEYLVDFYSGLSHCGVGDLRSEVRKKGIKATWVAFATKKICIWVLWCNENAQEWEAEMALPSFEDFFDRQLDESEDMKTEAMKGEEPLVIPKTMTEEKMTTSSQQTALASQIAELLTQKPQTPQVDEALVRELVSQEVAKLTPRKIEVTGFGRASTPIDQQHQHFDKLVKILGSGGNAFLVGEAGSGKTSAIFATAKAFGVPFGLVACNEMTDKLDFCGYQDATGRYIEGAAYTLYKNGGILGIDELEKGGANAMTALNALLANDVYQFPNGEVVEKHKDFMAIACGNTYGRGASRQYVGANQLDASTLDRFDVLEWDIDEKLEMGIATNKEFCGAVQALRESVRSFEGTIQLVVSMRATLRGEKLLAQGFEHKEIFEMLVYKGLDAGSKKKVADKAGEIMHSRVA